MRELVRQNLDVEPRVLSLKGSLKELRYFVLSMTALLLSAVFPVVEYQFIALSILTGMKWIVDSRKQHIIIMERSV